MAVGFFYFLSPYYNHLVIAYGFLIALSPVVFFFNYWFYQIWKDETRADFSHSMKLNFISATCLNLFFIYFFIKTVHVGKFVIETEAFF